LCAGDEEAIWHESVGFPLQLICSRKPSSPENVYVFPMFVPKCQKIRAGWHGIKMNFRKAIDKF
jgi:hypothetical protein